MLPWSQSSPSRRTASAARNSAPTAARQRRVGKARPRGGSAAAMPRGGRPAGQVVGEQGAPRRGAQELADPPRAEEGVPQVVVVEERGGHEQVHQRGAEEQ